MINKTKAQTVAEVKREEIIQILKGFSLIAARSFDFLEAFSYGMDTNQVKKLKTISSFCDKLLVQKKPKRYSQCNQPIKGKLYICFDCQQQKQSFLCEPCFKQGQHQAKCYYTVKQLPQHLNSYFRCCCGNYNKLCYKATCSSHHYALSKCESSLSAVDEQIFISVFSQFFQLIMSLVYAAEIIKKNRNEKQISIECSICSFFAEIIKQMVSLNQNSEQFLNVTQKFLLKRLSVKQMIKNQQGFCRFNNFSEDMTILKILIFLSKNLYQDEIHQKLYRLIKTILRLESEEFLTQLITAQIQLIHLNPKRSSLFCYLNEIAQEKSQYRINPYLYCRIMERLANNNFMVYTKGIQSQTLKFYLKSAESKVSRNQEDFKICSLISCWRNLRKVGVLTIQNIFVSNKSALNQFLALIIPDQHLFRQMITQLIHKICEKIQQKAQKKPGKKINLTESCNILAKAVLQFLQGKDQTFQNFMLSLNVNQQLCQIIFSYLFQQSLVRPANLGASLRHFSLYLHALQKQDNKIYQQYCQKWRNNKLEPEQFLDFMAKSLQIIIGQQLKSLKRQNHSRNQFQQFKQQKLKQFLFMRKQISTSNINFLFKQKALNFRNSKRIINELTKYDRRRKLFIYNSQQNYFHPDGILNNIFNIEFTKNLQFTPDKQDNSFTSQARRKIIQGCFGPILANPQLSIYLQKEQPKKFKLITKNCLYSKLVCLIIIDKIMNGEIKQLRQYLHLQRLQFLNINTNIIEDPILKDQTINAKYLLGIQQKELPQLVHKQETNLMEEPNEIIKNAIQVELNNQLVKELPKCEQTQEIAQGGSMQKTNPESQQNKLVEVKQMSKKMKLHEKFKQKRDRVLIKNGVVEQVKKKLHGQSCMICKSEGQIQNCLFRLGCINKQDTQKQILDSLIVSKYSICLCMHVICEKCFVSSCKQNYNCPLCKKKSNIIFPLQHERLCEKSRQFLQNRFIYSFIQIYNEYHPEKCFVMILKNLISDLINFAIFSIISSSDASINPKGISIAQQQAKIQYYTNLLKEWWVSFSQYEKQYYIANLLRLVNINENVQMPMPKPAKIIIDEVILYLVFSKISNLDYNHKICALLQQLENILESAQFGRLCKYLEKSIKQQLKFENIMKQGVQVRTKKKKILQTYFEAPKSFAQLQFKCSRCSACNKNILASNTYCLVCNSYICSGCQHRKQHGNIKAEINSKNGQLLYFDKNGKVSTTKIYMNSFMQAWGEVDHLNDDYFDYRLNEQVFNEGIFMWLQGLK